MTEDYTDDFATATAVDTRPCIRFNVSYKYAEDDDGAIEYGSAFVWAPTKEEALEDFVDTTDQDVEVLEAHQTEWANLVN